MAAFTALAIAGLGLAGVNAISQVKAGNAAKKAGKLQEAAANDEANLSEYNAQVADLQASDAIQRGQEQENRFRQSVKGIIGSQRAGMAAGNVDVGFGSALDVQADAAYLGELDALTIRTNAARESWGYKVQGEDLRRRALIQRKEGKNAAAIGGSQAIASRFQAAGTLLGGGLSLLETRYGFNRAGG